MFPISEVKGIGPATAAALNDHGISSAEQLAQAKIEDLINVSGIGEPRAKLLISAAVEALLSFQKEATSPPLPSADQKAKKDTKKKSKENKTKNKKKAVKKPKTEKPKAKTEKPKAKAKKSKKGDDKKAKVKKDKSKPKSKSKSKPKSKSKSKSK